jgi:hypothetical protein
VLVEDLDEVREKVAGLVIEAHADCLTHADSVAQCETERGRAFIEGPRGAGWLLVTGVRYTIKSPSTGRGNASGCARRGVVRRFRRGGGAGGYAAGGAARAVRALRLAVEVLLRPCAAAWRDADSTESDWPVCAASWTSCGPEGCPWAPG